MKADTDWPIDKIHRQNAEPRARLDSFEVLLANLQIEAPASTLPTKKERRAQNKERARIVELAYALAHRFYYNGSVLGLAGTFKNIKIPPSKVIYNMAENI